MLPQIAELNVLQSRFVSGGKDHERRCPCLKSLLPPWSTDTPSISRLQARKAILWPRRGKVVARPKAEVQKVLGDQDADRVDATILRPALAESIPCPPG
jgi:hypothetical protein